MFSRKMQKMAVALCGAMWRYRSLRIFKKMEKTRFPEKCKSGRGTMWHYVALSEPENFQKNEKNVFSRKMQKLPWHYVALCGAIGA